jgi:hypothetical protein
MKQFMTNSQLIMKSIRKGILKFHKKIGAQTMRYQNTHPNLSKYYIFFMGYFPSLANHQDQYKMMLSKN